MNLFVSDLDGTLLDKNAELPAHSLSMLNELIDKGMQFTVATARTFATVGKILAGLKINVPVILMNGVLVRDVENGEYVFKATMKYQTVKEIVNAIHKHNLYGFMYTVENNDMVAYYEKIATDAMRSFYEERKHKYYKAFLQTDDFMNVNSDIVYFSLLNTEEILRPLYEEICEIEDTEAVFYRDVYSEDLWYLEVFSSKASKKNAVQFLREEYNYDKVICFGDNLNDIPLFQGSDKGYAVENARQELKDIADGVIGANTDNGVAEFLKQNYGKEF